MPWLVYSMMEKNDTVKTEIFEKTMQCFFSPSNVPSKISISKKQFFSMIVFLVIDPNYDAKILNFPYPKF